MSLADATALGALWGEALSRAVGWTWACVTLGARTSECLISADRAHACAPLEYLASQRTSAEVTVLLLYNLIVAGQLPPSRPEALSRLG